MNWRRVVEGKFPFPPEEQTGQILILDPGLAMSFPNPTVTCPLFLYEVSEKNECSHVTKLMMNLLSCSELS